MKTLYLSPSTQENNIGVGDYGTEEFRCNLIADVIEKELVNNGIKIYRNKPDMTLSKIVKESNGYNVDVHLAVHTNAYNKLARGAEIYVHEKGGYSESFAKSIYKRIEKMTPVKDRGVKQGKDYYGKGKHIYELANVSCTAALIEISFHDNIDDAKWIVENIENIGINIANGVLEYFGVEKKNDNESKLYRVMVGSYKNLPNAKNHVKALQDKNIDSCIIPYDLD